MAHENDWVTVEDKITRKWIKKTWEGLPSSWAVYDGDCIWSDGYNTYLSLRTNNAQFVLNKTTSAWETKTWTGLTKFYGYNVWTDGDGNYYHSYKTSSTDEQYVLDRETSTWSTKTWTGLTSFNGQYIWTDGTNIYYSYGSTQKVLNKTTGAWSTKSWTGLTSFNGNNVWHDGEKTYYSYNGNHYILNKTTGAWETKTWSGLTSFNGKYIWTDGHDIYISYMTANQYVLDRSTDTWKTEQWSCTIESGAYVWHDGEKTYYSRGTLNDQYEFVRTATNKTPYRIEFPESKDSIDPSHFWYIDDDIPFQSGFPPLKESESLRDEWLIDDDIPYRLDFPEPLESIAPPDPIFWLQYAGYVPYRPWPGKIQIPNIAETVEIPEIDWTKSMQQTFEYFTVDPKTWYDDKQLFQIISSNHSIDLTSDLRGSATISTNELLGENYIRTYMVCKQGRYTHRICLGTYLYMTSDDSFNGIVHTYTMTGYTPLVELQESMPPIGFFIYGQIKKGDEAPLITDEIKKAILENTRCELEMNVTIPKPLLNNFVAGTDDNWLTVVNNLLTASNEARYMLTVDEWGTLQLKNSPIVSNMQPTFVYDDSNSSILLPEINTGDDLFQIPNTVELIFVGNTRFRPCRKIVKNEDEASPVSVQNRGREIVKRYTISNIAIPVSPTPTQEMIEEMIENQAYTLLETASTIQKTISYSHGYCGTKVGDCVMINYERAGLSNVKAVITSQKISCTPGCQVDETASYTKKYFKRN